jgi:magnesium and cobalt transporter
MVPRPDIVCADLEDGFDAVCRLIVAHGHSRIPVYKENRDHMVGVVYAKDLLRVLLAPEGRDAAPDLSTILREPLFISETLILRRILLSSGRKKQSPCPGQYGGTSGLLTRRRPERSWGEIEDRAPRPRKPEEWQVLDDRKVLVFLDDFPLEDLNERLGRRSNPKQVETIRRY